MATHASILAWKIAWMKEPGAAVHGVAKSQAQLSTNTFTFFTAVYGYHHNCSDTHQTKWG